jgi:hypothetical protein
MAGRVAQVIDHLPNKCKSWAQTPVPPPWKKKICNGYLKDLSEREVVSFPKILV